MLYPTKCHFSDLCPSITEAPDLTISIFLKKMQRKRDKWIGLKALATYSFNLFDLE